MYLGLIGWLEKHSQPCFYKKTWGIECPGCGFQRAFIELLKGNLWESILLYPALIPILCTFLFLVVHMIFKFEKGGIIIKNLFVVSISLIFINFLVKLIY